MAESENALIKASAAEPECQRLLQDGPYVAPMAGLLRFSRPLNCVMSAVGVAVTLMVSYENWLKARGAAGNLVIAYLVGSLFLFAGVSVFRSSTDPLIRTGILAALAFLATLGREITKDIEDMRGDVDRVTLPRRIGASRAGLVAGLALALCVALSFLPLYFGVLGIGYAVLVLPADGMFIYAALHSAANPARSQRVTKYAMIVALPAFLAGAFL